MIVKSETLVKIVEECKLHEQASTLHQVTTGELCGQYLKEAASQGTNRAVAVDTLQTALQQAGLRTINLSRYLKSAALAKLVGKKDLLTIPVGSMIALLPLVGKKGTWHDAIVDKPGTLDFIRSIPGNLDSEAVRTKVAEILGRQPVEESPPDKKRVNRMLQAFAGLANNDPSQAIVASWLGKLDGKIVALLKTALAGKSEVMVKETGMPGAPLETGETVKPVMPTVLLVNGQPKRKRKKEQPAMAAAQ
jgi:hypothetical protein